MKKQRHGCLTAWLLFVIVLNAVAAVLNVFDSGLASTIPGSAGWAVPVRAALAIVNVTCAVALLLWRRWGFYGLVVTTIVGLVVNVALGVNAALVLFGLITLA